MKRVGLSSPEQRLTSRVRNDWRSSSMRRECFDAGEIRKLQLEAVLVHTANKHVLNRENFPRVVEPLDERKGIITGHDLFPNS